MDKNSDYIFKAFIINSAEYDNGNKETSGAWLYFPTTKEEVSALFKEIGLPNSADSDTYFIDRYHSGDNDIAKFLSMYTNIDELNYLASRISELEDIEASVFQAAIQTEKISTISDAVNLTYNTEYYNIVPDIFDYSDVGKYYAEKAGFDISAIGELADFINYEAYGERCARENDGEIIDDMYLESGCTDWQNAYNGNIENIPSEYIVTENGGNVRYDYLFDITFEASKDLAFDIDRYIRSVDKEYSAKYPNDFGRMKYYSDCLIEGRTDGLKDILTAIGTLEGDELVDRIYGFEQEFPDELRESEERNMSDKMKVLVVEPMQEPYVKEIDTGLKSLQNEVGGNIQAVYPFEEEAAVICNEEGKMNGLELNRALYDDNGRVYDIIAGTFLICGLTGDSFGSLPDDLINKFSEQFKQPETFVKIGHEIISIPAEPIKQPNLNITENKGIINFGASSQNTVIHQTTQQIKTNSVNMRSVSRSKTAARKKPSVKKTLEQAKKEQGDRGQPKPPRKSPPEL